MSQLLTALESEFHKLHEADSLDRPLLKKCLDETHEFKTNLKKLRAHLNKRIQEEAKNGDLDEKHAKKRQLIIDKLHKSHKQWENGIKKQGKLALQQHNKFSKSALNKLYDFELDKVYVNKLPSNAKSYVDKAIGLHISRYNMSNIPSSDKDGMMEYLKNVYDIDPQVSSSFVRMGQIVQDLQKGDSNSCMEWCASGSSLEFELHLLKAKQLLRTGDKLHTYRYLLETIPNFMLKTKKFQLRHEVSPLLARLVVPNASDLDEERDIKEQLDRVISLFTKDYCHRNRLAFESPLFLIVVSGIISFQFFIKYQTIKTMSHVDWTTEDELPFDVKLPDFLTNFHPIFICPVLKEETTTENPPYSLPCHHIISKKSLDKLSKNGTCNFKCPYCPIMAARSKTRRVNFVML